MNRKSPERTGNDRLGTGTTGTAPGTTGTAPSERRFTYVPKLYRDSVGIHQARRSSAGVCLGPVGATVPSRLFPMQSRLFPVPSRSFPVTPGSSRRY
ncbi:hypothetical protein DPMN_153647 [Dreissena polymorpha]|uniref:Uncharacterized protein n=1 Tax=Dreissena polymorpha TaxID=45954 RepID=A0A9D4FKI5_DREPO|nr:hypothetical protein DPMN_153647 [Dreissena polymorpha]